MKKVKIKYNPYLVETEITVDGQKPKANSALNVGKKRLQEWVEKFPQIILDEYRDSNVEVDFTGTVSDYEDVESSFDAYTGRISAKYIFHKTADLLPGKALSFLYNPLNPTKRKYKHQFSV